MIGKIGSLLNSAQDQIGAGVPDWAIWILLVLLAGTVAVLVWVTVDYFGKGQNRHGHFKARHHKARHHKNAMH